LPPQEGHGIHSSEDAVAAPYRLAWGTVHIFSPVKIHNALVDVDTTFGVGLATNSAL